MNTVRRFWNFCSNCGANPRFSDGEIKRIKITNQLCLVAFICYIIFDSAFLLLDIPILQKDYFIVGLLFPVVIYLNYREYNLIAKLLLCAILYYGVFNMMFFYGRTFETNLLLFPVFQVPFFLFDTRSPKWLMLTIIVPFITFLYINMSEHQNPANFVISESQVTVMRKFVQLTAILVFFIVIYFYSRLNAKSEQSLTSKYSLLQEQMHTVFENSSDALLVIDTNSNKISSVNRYALELFQADKSEELLGKEVPDFHKNKLEYSQLMQIRLSLKEKSFWNGEIEFQTLKGNFFWGDLSVKRIETATLSYQLVRISDITQRKIADARLQASLREKEILIEEIHHRVKNNLAIVSGLLHLQSTQIEDPKLLELFDECRRRIKSMALIHEKLYLNDSFEKINFQDYVTSLLDSIKGSYNASSSRIAVETKINDVHLELKIAIPCALILNELISNAYKHAFVGKEKGLIQIEINKSENQLSLQVKDDGVGIPEAATSNPDGARLGLTLVHSLVEQISGSLNITTNNGSEFKLSLTV